MHNFSQQTPTGLWTRLAVRRDLEMGTMVSFDITHDDRRLIAKIVDRTLDIIAEGQPLSRRDRADRRINLMMDLTACHANGNPLRLAELAEADDFNVAHDVGGISRNIDRDTGELGNFFSPRFSQREPVAA